MGVIREFFWRQRYHLSRIEQAALERLAMLEREWIPVCLIGEVEVRLAASYIRFRQRGWAEIVASHEGGYLYEITDDGLNVRREAIRAPSTTTP